jgi:hypothetical protein
MTAPSPLPPSDYKVDLEPLECAAPRATYQEWFSWSVVEAIAHAVGLTAQVPRADVGKKDMTVETWRALEGKQRAIALQLKSTYSPTFVDKGRYLAYDLDVETYNELLIPSTWPRYLVVVVVPRPPSPLARLRPNLVALSAAAWWVKVEGGEASGTRKRVKIPVEQRLDRDSLLDLLRRA